MRAKSRDATPKRYLLNYCIPVTIILHQDPLSVTMPKIYKVRAPDHRRSPHPLAMRASSIRHLVDPHTSPSFLLRYQFVV